MSAENEKYDPALGVYDEKSLRAAGRYWEALQYEINGREDWIGDEYFRCERMLIAVERAMSSHDHGIDADDNYHKRTDTDAAEIARLRGEVALAAGWHDESTAPAEAKGDESRYPPYLIHDEEGDPIYSFPLGPYRVSVVGNGNKLSVLATEGCKIAYVGEDVEWVQNPAGDALGADRDA